jgi:hypothetical protein
MKNSSCRETLKKHINRFVGKHLSKKDLSQLFEWKHF